MAFPALSSHEATTRSEAIFAPNTAPRQGVSKTNKVRALFILFILLPNQGWPLPGLPLGISRRTVPSSVTPGVPYEWVGVKEWACLETWRSTIVYWSVYKYYTTNNCEPYVALSVNKWTSWTAVFPSKTQPEHSNRSTKPPAWYRRKLSPSNASGLHVVIAMRWSSPPGNYKSHVVNSGGDSYQESVGVSFPVLRKIFF